MSVMTNESLERPFSERLRPARWHVIAWVALLVIILGVALFRWDDFQFGQIGDDVDYYLLARSLFSPSGYGLYNTPSGLIKSQFPFGFPLLLAPAAHFAPGNISALRIVPVLATLIIVSLIFWGWPLISRRSYHVGLAVAALAGLNPNTMILAQHIASDAPFTAFLLASLLLTEGIAWRWRDPNRAVTRGYFAFSARAMGEGAALGALLLFTGFTRSIGLIAVPVAFGYLLFWGGRRALPTVGIAALSFLTTLALIVAFTSVTRSDLIPTRYLALGKQLQSNIVHARTGSARPQSKGETLSSDVSEGATPSGRGKIVAEYARAFAMHLENELPLSVFSITFYFLKIPYLAEVIGLAMSAFVVWGWFVWMRREGANVFSLFGLAYGAALTFWLWRDPRLLFPILAMLLVSLLYAVTAFARRPPKNASPQQGDRAALVFAALLCLIFFGQDLTRAGSRLYWGDVTRRTRWVKEHLPMDAVLLTREPSIDYFYGARHTVGFYINDTFSAAELRELIRRQKVTHILLAPRPSTERFVPPRIRPMDEADERRPSAPVGGRNDTPPLRIGGGARVRLRGQCVAGRAIVSDVRCRQQQPPVFPLSG